MKMEIDLEDNETSKTNFEYFQKESERHHEKLTPTWNLSYKHEKIDSEDGEQTLADADGVPENRAATVTLNKTWGREPVIHSTLSCTAYHEQCEVLLARLARYAKTGASEKQVTEAVHEVIRALERAYWKPEWKRRKK